MSIDLKLPKIISFMNVDFELPKLYYGIALDIDETLSLTVKYWVTEMQKIFGNPENLSVDAMIAKYRYTQNVPYWQSEEVLSWTEQQRNSNDLQTKLPLIPGADVYVRKLDNFFPIAAYISIRPDIVMSGTQQWLDEHSFPKAPLICRPKGISVEQGSEWKARVLEELYPQVEGIIDDNSSIIKFLKKDYRGVIFLFNQSKKIDSNIVNIPCGESIFCGDWSSTYDVLKKYFDDKL